MRRNGYHWSSYAAICFVLSALLISPDLQADNPEDKLGNWLIYNGTIHYTDEWSLFTEAQVRLWEPTSNLQEFFIRAIGQYHLSSKSTAGFGYTWVKTEPFENEKSSATENRLIEQFAVKQKIIKSVIEHRFRLEQRWIKTDGDTDYQNRFRYRLQATTPLFREEIGPHTHFLNFYNELFLNFGNVDDNFDQNRLYGAYGWQFTKYSNIQIGALWQAKKSADFFRLQIFYTRNFDL